MIIGLMQVSIAHDSDLLYYQGILHNYSGLQAWTGHQQVYLAANLFRDRT